MNPDNILTNSQRTPSGRDTSQTQGSSDRQAMTNQSSATQGDTPQSQPNVAELIDPATFQQQMLAMMNLLIQRIAANQQARQASPIPTSSSPQEPKVKEPETFQGFE
ncbi:hypothetical protein EHS25_000918 [Saitozyma podzolica]|uniref:Uncharacterized protein n=1 Tax=Saitozyma podzolica TaxID=1890683 RepID=A0A427YXL3_9TREE|nr:hypothetical protein EHS25_000918 [Saitozyma podzolica]